MEKKNLTDLTLQELVAKKKQLKSIIWGFGIVMFILSVVLLYVIVQSKKYGLLAVIPACWIPLLPVYINLGKLNAEINSRDPKENQTTHT